MAEKKVIIKWIVTVNDIYTLRIEDRKVYPIWKIYPSKENPTIDDIEFQAIYFFIQSNREKIEFYIEQVKSFNSRNTKVSNEERLTEINNIVFEISAINNQLIQLAAHHERLTYSLSLANDIKRELEKINLNTLDIKDEEITKTPPATDSETKEQGKKEKRSLKYRMHWEGDESELEETLKALGTNIVYDNIESALGTGEIKLNGENKCITAMAIFFVLAEYKAIKLEAQFAAQIAGVFSGITNKQVNKENGKCGHPFSMVGIEDNFQSLDDTFSKEELRLRKETKKEDNNFQKNEYNIRLFKSCLEHFRKKLLFLKKN